MLTRRAFLQSAAAAAPLAAAPLAAAPLAAQSRRRKPNFLVILADDMGYSDAGCYGGEIETPNLDALAANGLRFTQGYSTARCGPSRSCILTGRYAQETACDVMTPGNIPEWTRFAPQYLKPLGYRSYHSGKWHIRFRPVGGTGFDRSYLLIDQNRFFTPEQHRLDDEPLPRPKADDGFYATNVIADRALEFLKAHNSNDPFFFYLAFTSPHFPLHALQQDIDGYKDKFAEGWDTVRERRHARQRRMGLLNTSLSPLEPEMRPPWNTKDEELREKIGPGEVMHAVPWSSLTAEQKKFQRTKMAIHAAMITRMDREIGRVIAQLKAMNAFDDTVIIFASDNGASSEQLIRADGHDATAPPGSGPTHLCLGPGWSSAANTPFRLHKSWVHEGGISSPWIMHWPNGIGDAGKLRHNPCHLIDVTPTLIDLAGGKPEVPSGAPPLSGISIAPALKKDNTAPRDHLYFNHANNRAIRSGDYKLVAAGKDGPWELYDMRTDRAEQRNLAASQPDRVRDLAKRWQETDQRLIQVRETAPTMHKTRI